VEKSGREGSANLPKICLGPPQILQAKRTRGLGCYFYSAEGKEIGGWLGLVSLDRFARE
jgi:hypothetical protein